MDLRRYAAVGFLTSVWSSRWSFLSVSCSCSEEFIITSAILSDFYVTSRGSGSARRRYTA